MSFRIVAAQGKCIKKRKAEEGVQITLPSKDYVFSQDSIVSSVMLDRESYLIHPATSKFVNNNGDAWSNECLQTNYKSFIGAFNYVNHVQEQDKAVGFIADAVLRRRILNTEKNIFIYYVDILVATHRDNETLVGKILNGSIKQLSMGCDANTSQCSKCGEIFTDDNDICDHLYTDKGKYYVDGDGNRRIVAELLGNHEEGSVVFTEASWLTKVPAFHGAITRNILKIPEGANIEVTIPKFAMEREAIKQFVQI